MSVKIEFGLNKISHVDATMKLTMNLGEWEQLLEQMDSAWPAWEVGGAIRDLIHQAKNDYMKKVDKA
ncbi:hypothetical protein KAR91_09305 [Candidatus Pacearchaeota archaeon]|nr:hypothetical protein [Candidatus Pacearchaeota archaeon]